MNEKKIDYELRAENTWERRREFLALNPAGEVPVLVEPDGSIVAGSQVIAEFLEDVHPDPKLLGDGATSRAEVRRLVAWFDGKFDAEVTRNLVDQKVMKRFLRGGEPDSHALRAGYANIHHHLDYIGYLAERRAWLAGDHPSLADFAAAAHLSVVDYLGDVPWDEHEPAKDWYARVKSRPSVRPLLADRIAGFNPPKHYADLDF